MRNRFFECAVIILLIICSVEMGWSGQGLKVNEALKNVELIVYASNGKPVDLTVVEALKNDLAPQASIISHEGKYYSKKRITFRVGILDEGIAEGPKKYGFQVPKEKDWMFFRLTPTGEGELVTSKPHLLYALFCKVKEEWLEEDVSSFEKGRLETATFRWLNGSDGVWPSHARSPRHYDPEQSIKELARLGCSHISVNALASPFPYEQGPPDEIYYRFYYGSPDLDQFAETELNKGIYPPEYLQANMNFLKKNAKLALKYGITPGLYINTPRSVPESFFERYPFLRGARIDHTFRSYRPRYTMTLAHPVVRWHYAELIKKIMREVPELAYVGMRTNDAGSGFEYTITTYPGRNGGPYLIREWKSNEEIARAAGENVLRYLRLLRDAASEINPEFRVITSLWSFPAEGETILKGLGDRIDLTVSVVDTADPVKWEKERALLQKGSYLFSGVGLTSSYINGVPFPWLAHERLKGMISAGLDRGSVNVEPPSRVPYDINRQVLRAYHLDRSKNIDQVINNAAIRWVGSDKAPDLVKAWRLCNQVVRSFPTVTLYEGYGFYTLRLWNRPMVPDIEKIPEKERANYEKYINAIFNNPNLVDFGADALWTLISKEEAEKIMDECKKEGWKPLNKDISILEKTLKAFPKDSPSYAVFLDQRDRFIGLRCYYRTLKNLAAWIAGVHGYMDAKDDGTKKVKHQMVRDMVNDEIENTKELLSLWKTSKVEFMPISDMTESMYIYGENFGELLEKRIELMEKHKNDIPYINPNFMWRMPAGFGVDEKEYLKY